MEQEKKITVITITEDQLEEKFMRWASYLLEKKIGAANESPPSDIIGLDTACLLVGLKRPTIYSLCSKKRLSSKNPIPFFKVGSRLMFSRKDLEAWVRTMIPTTNNEVQK